ncbi:MAG: hypothetical protein K2L03_02795, partial [Bacteroidales bacterium]|nr:hypothetical protein [Bacteroidales bacterium]
MKNMKRMLSGWLLLIAMSVTAVFAQGAVRTAEATEDNAYWGQVGKNGYNQTVTDLPLAIVADSLKETWSMDNVSATQAVVAGDYLYCVWSYGNREVRKVDIATGVEEETQDLWSDGDLVYGDGKIFISQSGGYGWCGVLALDAETLDTLWVAQCETGDPYGTDNPWVYADGYIYGGFSGHYYCFSTADPDPDRNDETIEAVWHRSSTEFGVYEGILATIVGDDIYVGEGNKMLRLNRKTGEELDVLTLPYDGNIDGGSCYDAASGRLLFKDERHSLYSVKVGENGFDMDSQKQVNIAGLSLNNHSAPTVYNGRVYATGEKTLYVLDVETL